MVILSIIMYLVGVGVYFFGNSLLKKISVYAWLGVSLIFAVLYIEDILVTILYVLIGLVGWLLFNFVFKESRSDKKQENSVLINNVRIPSVSDSDSEVSVDATGSMEAFIITVYIKGKRFDFKVENGEISEYRSNKMRNFAKYEVLNDEE